MLLCFFTVKSLTQFLHSLHYVLVDGGETYAERGGYLLVGFPVVEVHMDDLACLWCEPSVDVVEDDFQQVVVGSSLPWFWEVELIGCGELLLSLSMPFPLRNYVEAAGSDAGQ
jgi:hypothetical protein